MTDGDLRKQCFELGDPELMKAALFMLASPVFDELRLSTWERAILGDAAQVYRKFGRYTWKQRKALREIAIKVSTQLVDRKEVGDAKDEVARWAAERAPDPTSLNALGAPTMEFDSGSSKALCVARLKRVDWRQVSEEKLESIIAILEDKAAPVMRVDHDGTPAEVCVVCGCMLYPRPQPHCEGCSDPEDVPEEELHIVFPPR